MTVQSHMNLRIVRIRADAIGAWVSLALEQPAKWVSALVAAALDRLNTIPVP